MLPLETHHLLVRIHFEIRTRREKKAPHAPGTHGSMAYVSALGFVLSVYCSMLQQMGVETKARATEEDRANTTTCMPGTYDKIFIDDEKAMLIPTQVSRDIRCG